MENNTRKKILVQYLNYNRNYEAESKKVTEIWEDKFNPEYHKRLFFRNIFRDVKIFFSNIDWKNPWMVTIIGGLIVGIILLKISK